MVFSSLEFIFIYFAVAILIYFMVPMRWRNLAILLVSLVFYGWGEPVYIFLMLFTITIDYIAGLLVDKYRSPDMKKSKMWMVLAVVVNLLILAFFKYTDFIITTINYIPGVDIPLLNISLPIGISFYTFQALSYVIDVYRADGNVQKNYAAFGAYVTLYPQLIAGPIVRYRDVDQQLRERSHSIDLFASGIRTFVCGLGKKVLLANAAGALAESFTGGVLSLQDGVTAFNWDSLTTNLQPGATVLGAWMGIIFFTFQIYFDFSGYSDMAIGLGKMMGFRFLENFNYPYIAKSITDFWRRWHISLSTWFREYVYIPLGGNRKGTGRTYFNLFIVWFFTGMWHGASWNFILWGLFYFVMLVIEKAFLGKILKKIPAVFSHIYTLFIVIICWVLFAFTNLSSGFKFLSVMFGGASVPFTNPTVTYDLLRNLVFIIILCLASAPLMKKVYYKLYTGSKAIKIVYTVGTVLLFIVCIAYLVDSSYNPFLYFRF